MFSRIIGIDLGATNIKGGVVADGHIERIVSYPTMASDGGDTTLGVLKRVVRELNPTECSAIGLGVPSVVDRREGVAYEFSNIRGWDRVPLKFILEREFSLPVYVDNDANCFTLAERRFGRGSLFENFVGITLGTGVGGGIITGGKLMTDANCGSGEFGMMPYKDSILEDYCASRFFINRFGMSGAQLSQRAQNGDVAALSAFDEYGVHLGNLVKIIMYAVDPQAVVFGGSIAKSFSLFERSMKRALRDFSFPKSVEKIQLLQAECEESGILGAAAICL